MSVGIILLITITLPVLLLIIYDYLSERQKDQRDVEDDNSTDSDTSADELQIADDDASDDDIIESLHYQNYVATKVMEAMQSTTEETGPRIDVDEYHFDKGTELWDAKYSFSYDGDRETIVEQLNNKEYAVLDNIIEKESELGLDFLADVNRSIFDDNEFLKYLREKLNAVENEPLMLYKTYMGMEKRRFDDWDYQYVYRYNHVFLLPDNRFAHHQARYEYSEIYPD